MGGERERILYKPEEHMVSYLQSGGTLQDEFDQQLHFGKHDLWRGYFWGQMVSVDNEEQN